MASGMVFYPNKEFLDFLKKYKGEVDLQIVLNFNKDFIQNVFLGNFRVYNNEKPKHVGFFDKTTYITKKEDLIKYLVENMKLIYKKINTDPTVLKNEKVKAELNKQHNAINILAKNIKKCPNESLIVVY